MNALKDAFEQQTRARDIYIYIYTYIYIHAFMGKDRWVPSVFFSGSKLVV